MTRQRHTDVLVVGAGPVGLCTALHLAESGVQVHLVDHGRRAALHSYGLALHPATLRMLDGKGLAMKLMPFGLLVSRLAFYHERERLAVLPIEQATADFPVMLVCPQSAIEAVLGERLAELGVKVNWNHRVGAFGPAENGVRARIDRLEEVTTGYAVMREEREVVSSYEMNARAVVGADGAESFVRRHLGMEYCELGPERVFNVFEFDVADRVPNEMSIVFHQGTVNVLWPLPEGRVRWSFQARAGEPEGLGPDRLLDLLRTRAPWFQAAPGDIRWEASVRFGQHLVDRWGGGDVWLAGDAAHLTYPMGVQGMNIGMGEGRDLAAALGSVLRGGPRSVLDFYQEERAAEWNALFSLRDGLQPTVRSPAWAREYAGELVPCLPGSGAALERFLRQLGFEDALNPPTPRFR